MESQNPFVPILNQLTKLMELIQEQSKISSKVPEEIKHDLQLLQEKYQKLEQLSLLKLSENQSVNMSTRDKRAIERVVKIKRDMRLFKMTLEALRKNKKKATLKNKENNSLKQRKKGLKSFRSDKDWIPL